MSTTQNSPATVRPAAVAGFFYPGSTGELAATVKGLLAQATPAAAKTHGAPKAIIAPHAGYIYSGPTAAEVYALIDTAQVRRVVLLGPTHRVAVRGIALPGATAFATPLGEIPVDTAGITALQGLPYVGVSAQAHAMEHSLEVHLPFLQTLLPQGFTLIPLAVGQASAEQVAEVLERLWGGPETLIVISSDLSHYLPYAEAQRVDGSTAAAILQLSTHISHDQACGATPVTGLTRVAQKRGLKATLVDLRNSGDTAGDRNRVVGYGAFAFYEEAAQ